MSQQLSIMRRSLFYSNEKSTHRLSGRFVSFLGAGGTKKIKESERKVDTMYCGASTFLRRSIAGV